MADKREPKQKTRPKGWDDRGNPAEPVEIPVPKRKDFESLLKRAIDPPAKGRKHSD